MNLVLKDATIIEINPFKLTQGNVYIKDNLIEKITTAQEITDPEYEVINCNNKLVMPGNVCSHGHIYSALARGMSTYPLIPNNFYEILSYVWWRLDRAIDEESLYYSALVAGLEALKTGSTSIIDHHASPSFITGSLDIIKKAFGEIGLRGILCYEVTDRGGIELAKDGIKENERFIKENNHIKNSHVKGMVGGHASFTLSKDTIDKCSEVVNNTKTGFHVHVAEDRIDVDDCWARFGKSIGQRLIEARILNNKSIIAHGVHLSNEDRGLLAKSGVYLAHNPRSNMNNHVGYSYPLNWNGKVILGTDGIGADMFEESHVAFWQSKEAALNTDALKILSWLWTGNDLLNSYWNEKFGDIKQGYIADLIVLDYNPPTPLNDGNFPWHMIFGINSLNVESVISNGKLIIKNRKHAVIDEDEIYAKAREVSKRLWKNMELL